MSENVDEFLYEYLEHKPALKFVYASSVVLACVFGVMLNSAIIFVKLRRFRSCSSFDLLHVSIAGGLNLLAVRFLLVMIEEITHNCTTVTMCFVSRITGDLGAPVVITSLLTMAILTKFLPNFKKKQTLVLIAITWTYAGLLALPKYSMQVVSKTTSTLSHNICVLFYENDENHKEFLMGFWISMIFKVFLPTIVFAQLLASALRSFSPNQHKNLWIYSMAMTAYFLLLALATTVTPLVYYNFGTLIGSRTLMFATFNLLCMIIVVNPIVLLCSDRETYRETFKCLACKRGDNEVPYRRMDVDENNRISPYYVLSYI